MLEKSVAQIQDQIDKGQIVNPTKGTVLIKYALEGEMTAIGKAVWWSERLKEGVRPLAKAGKGKGNGKRPLGERDTLTYLRDAGVPAIPSELDCRAGIPPCDRRSGHRLHG